MVGLGRRKSLESAEEILKPLDLAMKKFFGFGPPKVRSRSVFRKRPQSDGVGRQPETGGEVTSEYRYCIRDQDLQESHKHGGGSTAWGSGLHQGRPPGGAGAMGGDAQSWAQVSEGWLGSVREHGLAGPSMSRGNKIGAKYSWQATNRCQDNTKRNRKLKTSKSCVCVCLHIHICIVHIHTLPKQGRN